VEFLKEGLVIKSGIAIIIFLAFSCSQSPEKMKDQPKKNETPKRLVIKKPPSSFEDTVVIDHESAVFYRPDSVQLEKIKSVNEERVYSTQTHDCFYQMQNARNVIRKFWPRVRIVEVIKARYLLFIKKDGAKKVIDLNARNYICGLYIFDLKKDPEPVDMPNVNTFLGFYFGN
jgi:hypothetical protein